MTRKEYNHKILNFLRTEYPENDEIYDKIDYWIDSYPDQRFGQIICNYICPDYRSTRISEYTTILWDKWFGTCKFDPFYEESCETYNRLISGN